ncbi:hypothetical protein JM79_1336 [Gramella sp. Hel_I_59]|uniref:hypothetical protein n=1 Tax=Gramella sp. Hel_I_59 TaxID=1249978 RepID=UPI00114F96FD|nr:hypothetical protein [Gramella sp. Hel_I_59]TQI70426.1 hypothetical protein JM79_1336 [Gramella sp. Hel_I_59]
MKNIFLLLFIISITACSVDNEVGGLTNEMEQVNLEGTISNECTWSTYDFEDYGIVSVIDDNDIIYVKLVGIEGYTVDNAKLHAAKISSKGSRTINFPTVGNGNLPPGKMEFQKNAEAGSNEILFELDKSNYNTSEILIAVKATFIRGENSFSAWAGDEEGKKGDWLYFQYDFQNCEQCKEDVYVGPDYDITFTNAYQVENLNTGAKIDRFFENLLLDKGADLGGTYTPTVTQVKQDFQNGVTYFEINYTIEDGICEDSATILINVVDSAESYITIISE